MRGYNWNWSVEVVVVKTHISLHFIRLKDIWDYCFKHTGFLWRALLWTVVEAGIRPTGGRCCKELRSQTLLNFIKLWLLSVNDQIQILWMRTGKHYSIESKRSKDFKYSGKKIGQRYSPRSTYKGFSVARNKGTKKWHSTRLTTKSQLLKPNQTHCWGLG